MSTRIELLDTFLFIITILMIMVIIKFDILITKEMSEIDRKSAISLLLGNVVLIGMSIVAIIISFGRVNELNVSEVTLKDTYTYNETINGKGVYSDHVDHDIEGRRANYLSDKNQNYEKTKEFKKGDTVEIKIIETNGLFDKDIGNFKNAQIFIVEDNNLFEVPKSKIDQLGLKPALEEYYDLENF